MKANSVGIERVPSIISSPAVFAYVCFLSREKAACLLGGVGQYVGLIHL
jgi:hypothetical protein